MSLRRPPARTLIAGVGNIFLGDDGFGVETVRQLPAAGPLPVEVDVVDVGVRGVHLAYQLLDGYDTCILVDATARGGEPGTLYQIEVGEVGQTMEGSTAGVGDGLPQSQVSVLDGHRMSPDSVLALLGTLCAGTDSRPPRRTVVIGCEPLCLDEGIGLSEPVAGSVPEAVRLIRELLEGEEKDRIACGAVPSVAQRPAANSGQEWTP